MGNEVSNEVSNAAVGSVPPQEAGVASGTYNALRQLGGVIGVAVLAAVFTRQGGYSSAQAFVNGFTPALWVGAGLSGLGVLAALLSPGRGRRASPVGIIQPVFDLAGERDAPAEQAS